ncbi:MAG: HAD family hydrolase [Deltaproteobacteria bacterium]|nr:HAD family hydrolase [Deltaproteobacteria bacterium]
MARARSVCAHCRGPLPAAEQGDAYCCGGCRSAHELLTRLGLERFYVLAEHAEPGTPPSSDGAPSSMPWLPALVAAARAASPSLDRITLALDLQGLHCAACVWVIRALYDRQAGGLGFELNPGLGRLSITIDPARFELEAYLERLARVGYRAGPPTRGGRPASDGLGVRLGITIAIAMNAMAVSLATYLGLEPGDPDGLYDLFGWVNLALATAAMFVAAPVFIRGAWQALLQKTLHLDVPIALGVVLAYAGSVALFLGGQPELAYFDTLDTFLALMLLGRWAQRRFLDNNRRLLLDDDGFTHARVRLLDGAGAITFAPLAELAAGQRFLVAPGELVPVAADLEADRSSYDLAWITGESEPVTFRSGDTRAVPAGAHLAGRQAVVMIAREPFSASALHALLAKSRGDDTTSASAFWHRLTVAWVVTVLAFAAVTAIVWAADGASVALRHATAVLVVTCPCAIGLATPLAYELAHLALRRKGLLPRRPGVLDRATGIRHVVFDKTGTLTLTSLELADPSVIDTVAPEARERLWQLTARSNHPKSRALQAALGAIGTLDARLVVTETPGRGLDGGGHRLVHDDKVNQLVYLGPGSVELARFAFHEVLRPDARAEVAALAALGVDVHIASGDAPDKVAAVAAALGIPPERAHAGLTPEAKAALVSALGPERTLVMGDGINDAVAFDRAALAGTPAVDRPTLPARADFVVLGQGLGPVAELVARARRTRVITTRNLVIAGAYNVLGLVAGLAGWLTPVVAAIAMPLSSLLVLALTLVGARAALPRPTPVAALPEPRSSAWMPST